MKTYYEGCNTKLLEQIPKRRKVLELGCAAGQLGWHYKQEFPDAQWHGVDVSETALEAAKARLDQTHLIHLDRQTLHEVGDGFDCVVMGDVLEHLATPEKTLSELREITTPDAVLICCVPNMGHASVIEKLVASDLDYDDQGLLDKTHLRFFTRSSLVKLLLDTGWAPRVAGQYAVAHPNAQFMHGIVAAAAAVGVPEKTALANFQAYQYIFDCEKIEKQERPPLSLSVIVPVNNDLQFASNVVRSPGLREIGAQLIGCKGARSAAEAFEQGRARAERDWILYCHQDVYFPKGFGSELARRISAMGTAERARSVIGFAGVAINAQDESMRSGSVIDRGARFRHPSSERVVSLDEFAVVMHRDCELRIDPALGWHLWATDLCLQGLSAVQGPVYSSTVNEPVFHNSHNDYVITDQFRDSARVLRKKYPQYPVIRTLFGDIDARFG